MTIYFGNVIRNSLLQGIWNMPNYTGDLTIIYDNGATNEFNFTSSKRPTVNYGGNVNIVVNNVTGLTLKKTNAYNFAEGTAIQLVNNSTVNLESAITFIKGMTNAAGAELPHYIYSNATGVANAMEVTDQVGKLKINLDASAYDSITLVNADETIKLNPDADGYITVPAAGEYVLKAEMAPNTTTTYYVSPNGSDKYTGTKKAPLKSINAAIAAAKAAGYVAGDTVNIKLIKTVKDEVELKHNWFSENNVPSSNTKPLTSHAFDLKISSDTDKAIINMGTNVSLGGDTYFENVILAFVNGSYSNFNLLAHNAYFGTGVEYWERNYVQFMASWASKPPQELNYHFESETPQFFLGGNWSPQTFNNINITLDNKYSGDITFGDRGVDSGATTNFAGIFNVDAKDVSSFALKTSTYGPVNFTANFAAQMINSTGNADVTTNFVTYFSDKKIKDTETAVPYYVINNETGNKDAIAFTETVGVYAISGLEAGESVWVYNKNGEFIKKAANNSTIKLEPGEYDFTIGQGNIDYSFDVQEGTSIADAIQNAIDDGAESGDSVTLNLMANTNFGKLPKYNFNLVIQSEDKVTITVDNGLIANNAGMTTEYKNVVINNPTEYGSFQLAHSNAIFHKDASFVGSNSKLIFGYNNIDPTTEILHDQTVEINCKTPPNISLSNGINGKNIYNKDVNLIINNKDASTKLFFNAYFEGAAHYTTKYNGNVNINIKDAKKITLESGWDSNISFGDNSHIQFMIDGSTDFDYATLATKLTDNNLLDKATIIVDKTFQRRCVDFTETAGVFAIDNPYKVTATKTQTISSGAFTEIADSNMVVKTVENNQFTADFGGNRWDLTSNEYFEDFNDTTLDELRSDWTFTGDNYNYTRVTSLTEDGRLLVPACNYVLEFNDTIKNYNLNSKEQFISLDLQASNFGWYNGFAIYGRMEGKKGYEFRLSSTGLHLVKFDGVTKTDSSGSHFKPLLDGMAITGVTDESDGLMEYRPGTNTVDFNFSHIYRMGLSITTDYDKNGNEVALIRAILLNLTTNQLMFDETFRDTQPYTGTECAIYSPHGSSKPNLDLICESYVDNFYFSTEKFRTGDDGWFENDINGDKVYDIRDLVMANELLGDTSQTTLNRLDRDLNGTINNDDIIIVRKELLGGLLATAKKEFNLSGPSNDEAETTRKYILNSTSSYNTTAGTYTSTATVRENGQYVTKTTTYGNGSTIYFVANNESGNGTGTSANNAMSFDNFSKNYSNYAKSGNMILFKRGETYRISTETIGTGQSYFTMTGSDTAGKPTLFGAYGTGVKPILTSSLKNYAKDVTWTEVGGKNSNVWKTVAPEFALSGVYDQAPTNIIFDNGDSVGLRKGFPIGLEPAEEKLYTLYKEGDFTYDVDNKTIYLYSVGNPSSKHTSIEITRALNCISVKKTYSVVDNLNLRGFKFAVQGSTGCKQLTVTNCEIGFSGGVKSETVQKDENGNILPNPDMKWGRYANAIEIWDSGEGLHANYNWIYQTWDSAITTQANKGRNHDGMQVKGNLLEYNNCDIEIFDTTGSSRDNTEWTDNIMRFTTLGWGSREVSKMRDIHGVIRGGVTGATKVSIDWTNNIVDTPGKEFARFNNLTEFTKQTTTDDEGNEKTVTIYSGIFTFGDSYNSDNKSELGNNTYYFNPYVRSRLNTLWDYYDVMPEDNMTHNYIQSVNSKEEFYDVMTKFDKSESSQFYYLEEKVTSGS